MREFRHEYQKERLLHRIVPTVVIIVTIVLGISMYKDVKNSKTVFAQQVIKTESTYNNKDIIPIIGTSAEETSIQKEVITNTDDLISEANALKEKLDKEKERIAKQRAEEEAIARHKATTRQEDIFYTTSQNGEVARELDPNSVSVELGVKKYPKKVMNYLNLTQKYGKMFNVDPNVLNSIISQESSGDPYCETATSSGLTQIDACLESDFINFGKNYFGQTWTLEDRYLPAPSISYCAYRIGSYLDHYNGDYEKALQAYNYSHYSLDKLIAAFGEDWLDHTDEIAYYNGHYNKTGSTCYGDPNYVQNVLGFYRKL